MTRVVFYVVAAALICLALLAHDAKAAAQMWCLNETTQCSYGTPSISKLDKEERAQAIHKMSVSDYMAAVVAGTFQPITANELIARAKAYIAGQQPEPPVIVDPPPTPDPTPDIPADPALDFNKLTKCADKGWQNEGCWFSTEATRTFYLVSGDQWEKKIDNSWGTSCVIADGAFTSTDISADDAYSCYVETSPDDPSPPDCTAQGLVINNEGTGCVEPPPPDEQMPPPVTGDNKPSVDLSAIPDGAQGSDTLDIRAIRPGEAPTSDGTENGGQFRITCNYSHMNNDDPIVYPNQKGASHLHTFFGNTSTDYKSSPDTLSTTGKSTCHGGIANRSGYWVPSLIDTATHKPLEPRFALFYYKTGQPDKVIVPPKGLRMIAGVSSAQSPQSGDIEIVRYACNDVYAGRQASFPACSGDLNMIVFFPSCWDGKNLDSPDHKAHMAYSNTASCPASHPVRIPDITINVHYNVNGTSKLRLSSDNYVGGPGGYSGHADWMNGWDQNLLSAVVNNCLKGRRDCHANLLANGQTLFDKFGRWEEDSVPVPLKK